MISKRLIHFTGNLDEPILACIAAAVIKKFDSYSKSSILKNGLYLNLF